jgi:hypothetical protein
MKNMLIKQIMRFWLSICLCCLVFLNANILPAKAEVNFDLSKVQSVNTSFNFAFVESGMAESAIKSLSDGFWSGLGNVAGGIAGATTACYLIDALIVPIAPPVAVVMTTYCPFVGGAAGSFGGVVGGQKTGEQATKISKSLLKSVTSNSNSKLAPALF